MTRFAITIVILTGCSPQTADDPSVDTDSPSVGPVTGSLVIVGGGGDPGGFAAFAERAGDRIAYVPTSLEDGDPDLEPSHATDLERWWGFDEVVFVHTRSPDEADSEAFVAPMHDVTGVWFAGGRQWRLADSYLGTRAEQAFREVLDRGGAIGGSSAGASIQGSFLVRGDSATNLVVVGDHIEGFGYLKNTGIDQHVAQRGREGDLIEVLDVEPDLLGLGLDEDTWLIVDGDLATVEGFGHAYIHDRGAWPSDDAPDEEKYWTAESGDILDLATRQLVD